MGTVVIVGICFLAAFVALLGMLGTRNSQTKADCAKVFGAGLLIGFAVLFFGSITMVDTGHAAAVTTFGELDDTVLSEGFNLVAPWKNTHEYSLMERRYQGRGVSCYTADNQPVHVDFAFAWRLAPPGVGHVHQNMRESYAELVEDAGRSALRSSISEFKFSTTDEEGRTLQQQRGPIGVKFNELVHLKLDEMFGKGYVIVTVANIRDIDPGEDLKMQATKALKRQEEIRQERYQLELAEVKKKRMLVEAEAERDAQRTIAEGATKEVIALRYIETLERMTEMLKESRAGDRIIFWPMPPEGIMNTLNLDK